MQVLNPKSPIGACFTDVGAWELIGQLIATGHPVETVTLRHPPGKRAFVLHVRLRPDLPEIYVKLELGSGRVIGRSFHYSKQEV